MNQIGYTYIKVNNIYYIVTIEDLSKLKRHLFENFDFQSNKTKLYKIIKIEDIDNNIIDLNHITTKKPIKMPIKMPGKIIFWFSKEVPINRIRYKLFIRNRFRVTTKFTGIQKRWYDNGELYDEFFHINGRINGIYKSYYENGQLSEEINYINDKMNGIYKKYLRNGQLSREVNYIDGKKV